MSDNRTREIINKQITENRLDFLFDLYSKGVPTSHENIDLLIKHGYIKSPFEKNEEGQNEFISTPALMLSTEKGKKANSLIDIVFGETPAPTENHAIEIITVKELEERRKQYNHVFEGREEEITRKDWAPKSTTEHEPDFVNWINSINNYGFSKKIHFRKFALYCQQAYQWLSENKTSADFDDEYERLDYQIEELRRCDENALYWLNKYVFYQEGDVEDKSGRVKYVARPVHEFMAYMDDCGYSMAIVKGRQIAATTTLMSLDVRDLIFKPNHFMKFITEDMEKASEIFEDKLKFAFGQLPSWMRPNVLNDRDNLFRIGTKEEKGKKGGVGSRIKVDPPKRTSIAGGAPQKVKIDEAGNISILGVMIGNARPTMMWTNPRTGKMEIKRRLIFWGTGGEMEKGGKAFETEFMTIYNDWKDGKFSHAIVPIFFDWTCRFGATQEDFDREKATAYAKGKDDKDPNAKRHIIEFHQSWPTCLEDVFRTSGKTLVDEEYIEQSLRRINDARVSSKFTLTQRGYFEPVYDFTSPTQEGSDVPFKIIDAKFIPTDDIDPRACVEIFLHPNYEWKNRYFQGTDPIDTYTGASNFASAIWDKHNKTIVALLDWRIQDYQQVFLQSTLMGLYYDTASANKKGVKELVESNRGSSYTDYKKNKGFDINMVLNYQLPMAFQNHSTINEGVGIDNKGQRNSMIINKMNEMFTAWGHNFYVRTPFEQLKSFTCKISDNGKEMWGPSNRKYFMDDTLFGSVFSYICAEQCFPELVPVSMERHNTEKKVHFPLVRGKDGKLTRQMKYK